MSWGIRITILYLSFVVLILALAFTCFGEKVELESTDYYAKELKFQDQLNAMNNANALEVSIEHTVVNKSVELVFPAEVLSSDFKGTVTFFRPSDSSKDVTLSLKLGSDGKQTITNSSFITGVYKMQISFNSKGKSFYKEDVINFK